MSWLTIFGALAAGNQPLSLFDGMFGQVANLVAVPCTAANANNIVLTPTGNAPTITSYVQFQMFRFAGVANSTGAVTANFGGFGALPVFKPDGLTQVGSGDIVTGREYLLVFSTALNAGGGGFFLENATGAASVAGVTSKPGGRLTLATGTPVMTSTVSGAAAHFYTPYDGQWIPLNIAGTMTMTNFGGELTQLNTDATKSPAAVAASSCYYVFVWSDAGTIRATRGPVWTNDTTPGAGNALSRLQGTLVNTNPITNGPVALAGTMVGMIRSNAASTIDYILGGNQIAGFLGCWNMYNRRPALARVVDNSGPYAYTSSVVREARASPTNQVVIISGVAEDSIAASLQTTQVMPGVLTAFCQVGIGFDNTAAFIPGATWISQNFTTQALTYAGAPQFVQAPQLGVHAFSSIEAGDNVNATTFNGTGGLGASSNTLLVTAQN
jgi:hypothetical protein